MKNYTRIAHAKQIVNFPGETRLKIQPCCGGMSLAGCWVPTQLGRDRTQQKARGKGRDRERPLSNHCLGKTDSTWGN